MGNKATHTICLAEFDAAWPKEALEVDVATATRILEQLLPHCSKRKLKEAIFANLTSSALCRRDVAHALVNLKLKQVNLSTSLLGVAAGEAGDGSKVSFLYAGVAAVKEVLSRVGPNLTDLNLGGNHALVLKGSFFDALAQCPLLQELNLSRTQVGVKALAQFVATAPHLERLVLRGCEQVGENEAQLEALCAAVRASAHVTHVNLELCSIARDDVLAELVLGAERLTSLNISGNPLGGGALTLRAVAASPLEQLEARKIQKKREHDVSPVECEPETYAQLARARHLYALDLRGNELSDAVCEAFLAGLAHTPALYSLKMPSLPAAPVFEILRANHTLGVLCFEEFEALGYANVDTLLGDNSTLFILQPDPPQALGNRLRINLHISRVVRQAIVLLQVSHRFHREQSGWLAMLPKDLIKLLCQYVWRSRRDRAWLKVAQIEEG